MHYRCYSQYSADHYLKGFPTLIPRPRDVICLRALTSTCFKMCGD